MIIWILNNILQRWLDLHLKLRVPGHLGALHHPPLGHRRQERQDVLTSGISGKSKAFPEHGKVTNGPLNNNFPEVYPFKSFAFPT